MPEVPQQIINDLHETDAQQQVQVDANTARIEKVQKTTEDWLIAFLATPFGKIAGTLAIGALTWLVTFIQGQINPPKPVPVPNNPPPNVILVPHQPEAPDRSPIQPPVTQLAKVTFYGTLTDAATGAALLADVELAKVASVSVNLNNKAGLVYNWQSKEIPLPCIAVSKAGVVVDVFSYVSAADVKSKVK